MRKLKIGLCVPYEYTAPPPKNTIRAPNDLWVLMADALTKKGHSVTLFAPKGSKSKAKKPMIEFDPLSKNKSFQKALKTDVSMGSVKMYRLLYNQIVYTKIVDLFKKFDIVHAVFVPEFLPIAATQSTPMLFTFHDPLLEQKTMALKHFKNTSHLYFNSISLAQQKIFPSFKYDEIVYNGTEIDKYPFYEKDDGYAFFSGRMRRIKGPEIAIRVAKKLNIPLKLAGETSIDEQDLWDNDIEPYLSKKIKYLGMLPKKKLPKLYGRAKVLLMPINIPESFGLVMTEAMSVGTPVVAFDSGSPKEVIKHGKTGYIVKNERQMIKAVKKIYDMPADEYLKMRKACRKHVEDNFSVHRMVENYEKLYYKIVSK